jgi:prevent-host-death family protein
MRKISAAELKVHSSAVLKELQSTREPVIITKRGKPFVRLVPAGRSRRIIGSLKGKIKILGYIVSPIVPADDWEYDRDKF